MVSLDIAFTKFPTNEYISDLKQIKIKPLSKLVHKGPNDAEVGTQYAINSFNKVLT